MTYSLKGDFPFRLFFRLDYKIKFSIDNCSLKLTFWIFFFLMKNVIMITILFLTDVSFHLPVYMNLKKFFHVDPVVCS